MKIIKKILPFFLFVLVATAWSTVCFVFPYFLDNPTETLRGFFIVTSYMVVVSAAIFFLIYAAAAFRWLFALFFPIFCSLGAVVAYFRYAFKATITPMIIDATFHNDFQTSFELITIQLMAFLILNLAFAIAMVIFRFKKIKIEPKYASFHCFAAIALLLVLFTNGRLKSSLNQRYPFNVYDSILTYNKLQQKMLDSRFCPDTTIYERTDSLQVVLVLGESLRADHLSINGYERQTTPKLALQKNLISFPNIYSEYTYTNISLPHILTRADSANVERAYTETSFVKIFKNSDFKTAWISCQDPAESYVSFIAECDTAIFTHPEKSVYVYSDWFDNEMLLPFDTILQYNETRQLILFHSIGSHWYYNNHVPKHCAVFLPLTGNRTVVNNSPEQIINSYDNTVITMDDFLDAIIERLKTKKALLIYLSDHGESLGEYGNWLHASDNYAIKNPACFVWYSDSYAEKYPQKIKALQRNANKNYRTDFFFHSVLSAADIPSVAIDETLNIFGN